MKSDTRDDFTSAVKRILAERSAYICANPSCRKGTIGPHPVQNKSLKTGEACHIYAASQGGPRFNASQTKEDRRNITNGIWLCVDCSTKIDKDELTYPPVLLIQWKSQHEDWIKNGGVVPARPEITLSTINGRVIPEEPSKVEFGGGQDVREHILTIKNNTNTPIHMIDAYIQLPEPVIASVEEYKPAGVDIIWKPKRMQMIAVGSGSFTRTRPPSPVATYNLQIDHLPPGQCVTIRFSTSLAVMKANGPDLSSDLYKDMNDGLSTSTFINGTYQYEYHGATLTRRLFAPIKQSDRQLSLIEVRDDLGDWKISVMQVFS